MTEQYTPTEVPDAYIVEKLYCKPYNILWPIFGTRECEKSPNKFCFYDGAKFDNPKEVKCPACGRELEEGGEELI